MTIHYGQYCIDLALAETTVNSALVKKTCRQINIVLKN